MDNTALSIIDVFLRRRFVSPCAADLLTRYAKRWQVTGFQAILDTHVFSESTLANLIGESFKIDRIFNLEVMEIPADAVSLLPYQTARDFECLVTGFPDAETGRVEVVFADPTRPDRTRAVADKIQAEITLAVAERSDIVRAIHGKYRLSEQLSVLTGDRKKESISYA